MQGPARRPKYRQVFDALQRDIVSGRLTAGTRLPSEAALERQFGASRITVGRAVRDLQLAGMVERRPGSGSYVKARPVTDARLFGLLIPDLGETEIFEPICQGMMASPHAGQHALIWGSLPDDGASKEIRARELCRQYVERGVSGVFFAPLELRSGQDTVNREIAQALDAARIPVVLLDRTVVPYPGRGTHDLIGIDNRRAGYKITDHLLRLGAARIAFAGIDDMDYASLLPIPLTTLRQPTRDIGAAAFAAMLDRVTRPDTPVRDIFLQTELIVRRSCGAT